MNKNIPYYNIIYKDLFTPGDIIVMYENEHQAHKAFSYEIMLIKMQGLYITDKRESPSDRSFHLVKYVFKDGVWKTSIEREVFFIAKYQVQLRQIEYDYYRKG